MSSLGLYVNAGRGPALPVWASLTAHHEVSPITSAQLRAEIKDGVEGVSDPIYFDWVMYEPNEQTFAELEASGARYHITRHASRQIASIGISQQLKNTGGVDLAVTVLTKSVSHFVSQLLRYVRSADPSWFCITAFFDRELREDPTVSEIMVGITAEASYVHDMGLIGMIISVDELRKMHSQ